MILFPDILLDSIYDIDPYMLKDKGIKGLIIDIDNTLVAWDIERPDNKAIQWIKTMTNKGFKICLISNNTFERVRIFNESLNLFSIPEAKKPTKKSFLKALKKLKLKPEQIAVIGDQIFTDVLGGNRFNMFTILVRPISDKEFPFIQVKRFIEKIILALYKTER